MIFSGYGKRSIADQVDTFGFDLSVTMDNLDGSCKVGFSGDHTTAFLFRSGKIFDPQNNFVQSYDANQRVDIYGQIGQSSYDYTINTKPIALGYPCASGRHSWFFVDPQNCAPNVNVGISGNAPLYNVSGSGYYQGSGSTVTGYIFNETPNQKFRIFDAEINSLGGPYSVKSFTTGDITTSGQIVVTSNVGTNSSVTLPIALYTNFGEIDFDFFVGGNSLTSNPQNIYLSISPSTDFIRGNQSQTYSVYYSNYPSGAALDISLSYESGVTGVVYKNTLITNSFSDVYSQSLSGTGIFPVTLSAKHLNDTPVTSSLVLNISGQDGYLITGSGKISKYVEHIVTGHDDVLNQTISGSGSGILNSDLLYASGPVNYDYDLKVIGNGQGTAYHDVMLSGNATTQVSGLVPYRGMFLTAVAQNIQGIGASGESAIMPFASGDVYVYPTGTAVIHFDLSQYSSSILVKDQCYVGPATFLYDLTGVGLASGGQIAGIVDSNFRFQVDPGNYEFTKPYQTVVFASGFVPFSAFDPVNCQNNNIGALVSGVLDGTIEATGYFDCSSMPFALPISGVPSQIYYGDALVSNSGVYQVIPQEGFALTENSLFKATGGFTRTSISQTDPSRAFFDQIIQGCDYLGGWGEKLDFSNILYSGIIYEKYLIQSCDPDYVTPNYIGARFWISGESSQAIYQEYPSTGQTSGYYENLFGYVTRTGLYSGLTTVVETGILIDFGNQVGSGVSYQLSLSQDTSPDGTHYYTSSYSGHFPVITSGAYSNPAVGITVPKTSVDQSYGGAGNLTYSEEVSIGVTFPGVISGVKLIIADVPSGILYDATRRTKGYPSVIDEGQLWSIGIGGGGYNDYVTGNIYAYDVVSGYPLNAPMLYSRTFSDYNPSVLNDYPNYRPVDVQHSGSLNITMFRNILPVEYFTDIKITYSKPPKQVPTGISYAYQSYEVTGQEFIPYGTNELTVDSGILNFVLDGTGSSKTVAMRALSPSISGYNNPDLILLRNGAFFAYNNGYSSYSRTPTGIFRSVSGLQANGLSPSFSSESAMILDLPPGNYSAISRSVADDSTNTLNSACPSCSNFSPSSVNDNAINFVFGDDGIIFDESSLVDFIVPCPASDQLDVFWDAPRVRGFQVKEAAGLMFANVLNPLKSNLRIYSIDSQCKHTLLLNTAALDDASMAPILAANANPNFSYVGGSYGKGYPSILFDHYDMLAANGTSNGFGSSDSAFFSPPTAMQFADVASAYKETNAALGSTYYTWNASLGNAYLSGCPVYQGTLNGNSELQNILANSGGTYNPSSYFVTSNIYNSANIVRPDDSALPFSPSGQYANPFFFKESSMFGYYPTDNFGKNAMYVNNGYFAQKAITMSFSTPSGCQKLRIIVETRRDNNYATFDEQYLSRQDSLPETFVTGSMIGTTNSLGATQPSLAGKNSYPVGFPVGTGYNPLIQGDVAYNDHIFDYQHGIIAPLKIASEQSFAPYPNLQTLVANSANSVGIAAWPYINSHIPSVEGTELRKYFKNTLLIRTRPI